MEHILFGAEAVMTLNDGGNIDELVHIASEMEITLEVIEVSKFDLKSTLDKAVWWEAWCFISIDLFELLLPHSTEGG